VEEGRRKKERGEGGRGREIPVNNPFGMQIFDRA
jgi:hypothetical protein